MHEKGYVYRDIKTENILLDGDFTVKRIKKENGVVWLIAENEDYKPIKVTEENELMIWGIVIHSIKTF